MTVAAPQMGGDTWDLHGALQTAGGSAEQVPEVHVEVEDTIVFFVRHQDWSVSLRMTSPPSSFLPFLFQRLVSSPLSVTHQNLSLTSCGSSSSSWISSSFSSPWLPATLSISPPFGSPPGPPWSSKGAWSLLLQKRCVYTLVQNLKTVLKGGQEQLMILGTEIFQFAKKNTGVTAILLEGYNDKKCWTGTWPGPQNNQLSRLWSL